MQGGGGDADRGAPTRAETATAEADKHKRCTEPPGADRRNTHQSDPQTDGKRQLPESPRLSDVQHGGQFAEIAAMVAELERQRAALFASAAALVEQLTLAGVAERLSGADAATIDRVLGELLGRLAQMLAPDIAAAAQAQGRPLSEAERALASGAGGSDWRLLAELLARLQ